MITPFSYTGNPARILFGPGKRGELASEIERLSAKRALILSTSFQAEDARQLAASLGPLAAGVFSDAAMHTPVDVTNRAMEAFAHLKADCIVSLGGGSAIGLGKALALRTDAVQIALPTTYAGSEVTPILGQTEASLKTTQRSAKILPETVIYDPELTFGLPVALSITSGLNAMAHAIEALYAQDRNPISSLLALEAIRALHDALPKIVTEPHNPDARANALYGSWLCGTVLGTVGMALHHKLCHTLGGTFELPHAETHAILLPHTVAYTEAAVPELLTPVATIFGARTAAAGLFDFVTQIGAPRALSAFGLKISDLDRAVDIATQNPYWNPRPIESRGLHVLLTNALTGQRPQEGRQ